MNLHPTIVVVDNFLPEAAALITREVALTDSLELHPDRHKGVRGTERPIPDPVKSALARLVGRSEVTWGYSVYQACVAGDQVVFHADENDYAATLYLTPDAPYETGLSFYASRLTDLRTSRGMTPDEASITFDNNLLDSTAWTEVDRVGNVFNRLVVWDARLLHAATGYFGTTPKNGRLFEMTFFDAK